MTTRRERPMPLTREERKRRTRTICVGAIIGLIPPNAGFIVLLNKGDVTPWIVIACIMYGLGLIFAARELIRPEWREDLARTKERMVSKNSKTTSLPD